MAHSFPQQPRYVFVQTTAAPFLAAKPTVVVSFPGTGGPSLSLSLSLRGEKAGALSQNPAQSSPYKVRGWNVEFVET